MDVGAVRALGGVWGSIGALCGKAGASHCGGSDWKCSIADLPECAHARGWVCRSAA